MALKQWSYRDYSVGWICALSKEQTAAMAMLDERHPRLANPPNDNNSYTLGSIGPHNVVIACLPKGQYGTNSAANVASLMVTTFPFIKIGLMVGIGGGVPSKVRLGDVVVSTPTGQFPGVVQWDLGKATKYGRFERTGALSNPPGSLLKALSTLEAEQALGESKIPTFLKEMAEKYPKLAAKYLRSDSLQDILFQADYDHVHVPFMASKSPKGGINYPQNGRNAANSEEEDGIPCMFCDRSKAVERQPQSMEVHYGLIASGNGVIVDPSVRDALNSFLGGNVLCFEMEAAGLMNHFPCLVIRGICDYCDSHKNKTWQEHAAAVAAAFAKELLGVILPSNLDGVRLIKDVMNEVKQDMSRIENGIMNLKKDLDDIRDDGEVKKRKKILDWISPLNFQIQQHEYFSRCEPETGQEFIKSEEVQNWLATSKQTLFCQGVPGAGKTFQTAILIDHMVNKFRGDDTIGVAFLYYNFKRRQDQKAEAMLANLIKQLAQNKKNFPDELHQLHNQHDRTQSLPSLKELSDTLTTLVRSFSRVFILIDALDEGDDSERSRTKILDQLLMVQKMTSLNLFTTSRSINEIGAKFEGYISRNISPSHRDISIFLNARMSRLPTFVKDDKSLQNEIKGSIESAIDGMFLIAELYINCLASERSLPSLRASLTDLRRASENSSDKSKVLDLAYDKSMKRIQQQNGNFPRDALLILCLIVKAKREITVMEVREALAVEVDTAALNVDNMPTIEHIVQACAPLVIVDEDTIRLVHYTAQEYFERSCNIGMENAHASIASVCMAYLSFPAFQHHPCLSRPEFDERVKRSPFYRYAVRHWGDHTRDALSQGLEPFRVIEFLEYGQKRRSWYREILCEQEPVGSENVFPYCDSMVENITTLHVAAFLNFYEVAATILKQAHAPNTEDSLLRGPLWWAAYKGHARVVYLLLGGNAGLKITDAQHISTALIIAIERGHETVVKLFIEKCDSVSKDICGWTPLAMAALRENQVICELLFQKGANIEARDSFGRTLLALTTEYGCEKAVQWLIEKGANMEARDYQNRTPLALAANGRREEVVDCPVPKGAHLGTKDISGQTPPSSQSEAAVTLVVEYVIKSLELQSITPFRRLHGSAHEAIAEYLIEKGANIEATDINNETPLILATRRSNERVIGCLIDKGADMGAVSTDKHTPLILAITQEDFGIVKLLVEKGANLNARDGLHWTPLMMAIELGNRDILGYLIDKGADLEAEGGDPGYTPLILATAKGHKDIVESLIEKGADLEAEENDEHMTALALASQRGFTTIIGLLIEKGANLEARNRFNWTPLHLAAVKGHLEAVQLLLAHRVYLEAKSLSGWTALALAAIARHPETVQLLLSRGANTEVKANWGHTPLSLAVVKGHTEIIKLLLESKADTSYRDECGGTLMHIAIGKRIHTSFRALLKFDTVDANERNHNGHTPLFYAIEHNDESMVKALLDSGKVDAEAENYEGLTPLLYAIQRQDKSIVKALLDSESINVNAKSNKGQPPLSFALEYGGRDIIKALLNSEKIDADAEDSEGYTPLLFAIKNNKYSIMQTLLDSGKVDANRKDTKGRIPLSYATRHGKTWAMKLMLKSWKVDVNTRDINGRTPLSYATSRNVARILLEAEGIDVKLKDNQGRTPLWYATQAKNRELVKLLEENIAQSNSVAESARPRLRIRLPGRA